MKKTTFPCKSCGDTKRKTYFVNLTKDSGHYCEACVFDLEDKTIVNLMELRKTIDKIIGTLN